MSSYIEDTLIDARGFFDELLRTKQYYDKKGKFTSFYYEVKDLKRFKLFLLSALFTENFDELIQVTDEETKKQIINNETIYKVKSDFSFENGEAFKSDFGVNVKTLPKNVSDNDYTKILNLIRNAVAHSHYEYDDGKIKNLNAYQNQFQSECDVDWLEMMVLCLFANKRSTHKPGERDIQIEGIVSTLGGFDFYMIEVANGEDDSVNFNNKIAYKDKMLMEIVNEHQFVNKHKCKGDDEELFRAVYEACDLNILSFTPIDQIIAAELEHYEIYNELNVERKARLIRSIIQYYYDNEKRNTIGYKNTLELLNIAKSPIKKQEKKLMDTGVEFMMEPIIEYTFKAYVNFVFNYMLGVLDYDMSDINFSRLTFTKYDDAKPIERHLRNACCHDRIKINYNNVYVYDQTNSGTVNFQMYCKIDDFIDIIDQVLSKLKKQGLINVNYNKNSNRR